jgi:predicted CXXCH cytochrome family protein
MKIIKTLILFAILCMVYPVQNYAAVSGPCYRCHTMHNSQNGDSKNMPDTVDGNIGWNSSDELSGGSRSDTPAKNLLVTNCVGCHSSSTGETIVEIGDGTRIPIVYNTVPPTDNVLAGGNFYWVGSGDDTKGHNVYGIAGQDPNHVGGAPGNARCSGDNTACHNTLAVSSNQQSKPGCQGCHINVFHHNDNGQYRFLNGHQPGGGHYVEGQEHVNWEQDATESSHNYYKGYDGPASASASLAATKSISTYCSGCHFDFHRKSDESLTGIGDTGVWVRHPVDIALPTTGEFAEYDPVNSYDIDAPVAWTAPTAESKGTPIVMCLSCHRPHGSDQPDMLRWNYTSNCLAGISNADCGCFTCHTDKD